MSEQRDPARARTCRACGCTDSDCRRCIERTGVPCHWVEADLCSACPRGPDPSGPASEVEYLASVADRIARPPEDGPIPEVEAYRIAELYGRRLVAIVATEAGSDLFRTTAIAAGPADDLVVEGIRLACGAIFDDPDGDGDSPTSWRLFHGRLAALTRDRDRARAERDGLLRLLISEGRDGVCSIGLPDVDLSYPDWSAAAADLLGRATAPAGPIRPEGRRT